ncbi:hypothetical protein NPIL_571621 [Nephila pilipes]|uniref:Uncharacterized protein n=1 Tax=Nephila pilipes TaxID=299642 RepID=A0A8X6U1U5_NEPPI|nr:hypothetical protein NPIL_571621 [Nephila pilipes]
MLFHKPLTVLHQPFRSCLHSIRGKGIGKLLTGFPLEGGAGGSTCAAGEEIASRREERTSVAGEGDLSTESPPMAPSASQRWTIFRSGPLLLEEGVKFSM